MDPGEARASLDALAELRIRVFAEWPYLYDGDRDYEARYLARLAGSPGAVVVGAWDGERLVGAATGAPMEDHAAEFAAPLMARGLPLDEVFYLAESVLLPAYRGQGAGHRFFDLREDHARRLGRRWSAFAAIVRPPDHPARPAGARSLEPFWRKRGYAPLEGAVARFSWREHGEAEESAKPLQLWLRQL
ncbi:GNAT family N-acetyltransferase [Rubellimicrobium sp. CFH 75288]|uniref:GNAT family N-acetyltransferase n=1 Tax=Rubellimicrobium sp. CFH 75288 TaxID=2697034 RepID=UPI0014130736|nr:GNAT family N-acetyltransferase [Rubellimicrobium sp. CFH 75288]NAZ37518.1 GNAT family N-acetyltransferase [Rubellimicrobium sp. CFH 75288]